MDRTVVDEDTADYQQAQYYRALLSEHRREVDGRIASYQTSMARHVARGNVEDARRVRRMLRVEERQRQTLTRLLDNLDRRFAPPDADPARPASRRSTAGSGASRPSLAILTRQAVPT
jgi:hypothetical protein